MKEIKWLENRQVQIELPKRTKKITGTRFATILGRNEWATPFEMWCAITKLYEAPFEDTVYTIAGKTIEPKQAEYMRKAYGMKLVSPESVWGKDYFNKTYGDFFPSEKHLGGMWDYLSIDERGKYDAVLEMKTTKRAEDWEDDIPEYYALQAALYAFLLGLDDVVMVCSFLTEKDYEAPEKFVPNASNTITVEFKVSERYPDFAYLVKQAEAWWEKHVDTGISPKYDEKKDEVILKALRTASVTPDEDLEALLAEAGELKSLIDGNANEMESTEKRYKVVADEIKKRLSKMFKPGDKKACAIGGIYTFTLSKSETESVDKDALKADGLYEKYMKKGEQLRLTVK